ncbi:MAG: hypothetical protein ACRBN8_41075 [Nannocystales bacterium]
MHRLSTLRFTRLGRVIVLVHGKAPPSGPDWTKYLETAWSYDAVVPDIRTLVLTDGGGPDTLQRGSLTTRVQRYGPGASAVVSGTRKVRLTVTALSWFFSNIKFFGPDELTRALGFLELEEKEQSRAIDAALHLLGDGLEFDWKPRLLATKQARAEA